VLRRLAQRVCRPLASAQTTGAYACGRRLMAIDRTLEDVPDTPANAAFFGRVASGPSASPFPSLPFPQARCLYLAAAGTHGLVNALVAPCRESPHRLFKGLLRSSSADMLVLLERGLFSGAIFEALRARGARARLEPACSPSRCACCRTAVTWCS